MTAAIVCAAVLAALVFVLGANVSRLRARSTDQVPVRPDDPLFVAIRTHANAAEYVPTLIVLMLLVGSRHPAAWMVATFFVATAARITHATGLLVAGDMARNTPLRTIGASGTYACGLALCVAALIVA